ncbi:MAG: LLM class flavin-dependent oxidoreductase [Dehalococcoidia bacterium]|nr:LLM class flavin-dependent oxidoreductase [Dehalococcoidia bacterium]
MANQHIGITVMGGDSKAVVARIVEAEQLGVSAAWLTTGGAGLDGITLFAAAAPQTKRILLGTCITPTYPRHPITAVQQVQVVAQLAPGRFRLGVGPSHKPFIEPTYGFGFNAPLTNLREYIHIVKTLLREGSVEFDGREYHAHTRLFDKPITDMPIMASALRQKSFELCGEVADGAISWVCPGRYLRDVALPAMRKGAKAAGRETPPLVVHAPVCVHDDVAEACAATLEQVKFYPSIPFYQQMFVDAGYPEARNGTWSDKMLDDVAFIGNEGAVAKRLRELFAWGAGEVIAQPVTAGKDHDASWRRTVKLLAQVGSRL